MPIVSSDCFNSLTTSEKWEQLYLAIGGTSECFKEATVFEQQRLFLAALGSEECIYTTEDFWRAWAAFLGIECVESVQEAQRQIYAYYYDQAGDDTLADPSCFEGLGPDGQLLALFESLLDSGDDGPAIYASSSEGNDSNTGLTTEDPVATIAAAMTAAEESGLKRVRLLGGDTFYEPVDWGISGEEGTPALLDSYGTGFATISGGVLIEDEWTLEDADKNIWSIPFLAATGKPRNVWVNGIRCKRSTRPFPPTSQCVQSATGVTIFGANSAVFDNVLTNQGDQEVVMRMNWQEHRIPRRTGGFTPGDVNITEEGFDRLDFVMDNVSLSDMGESAWSLDNVKEHFEADASSCTFYHDLTEGVLYLCPPVSASDPNAASVVVPIHETILTMSGSADVTVTGIRFSHTTNLRPTETGGYVEIQAGIVQQDASTIWNEDDPRCAVVANNCTRAKFLRCEFEHLGNSGLHIKGASAVDCEAKGNWGNDLSGSLIYNGSALGVNANTGPTGSVITNNLLRRWGVEFAGSCGITHFFGTGTIIDHNDLAEGPYTGISAGWGWGDDDYLPNCNTGIRVRGNKVRAVNRDMFDGGGIYLNSGFTDTEVTGNYCYDIGQTGGFGQPGLYMDNGTTSGILLSGNVVHSCLGGSQIKFNAQASETNTTGGNTVESGGGTTFGTVNAVSKAAAIAAGEALNAGLEAEYADLYAAHPEEIDEDDFTNGLVHWVKASSASDSESTVAVSRAVDELGGNDLCRFTGTQPEFVPDGFATGVPSLRFNNSTFIGPSVMRRVADQSANVGFAMLAAVKVTGTADMAFGAWTGGSPGAGLLSYANKRQAISHGVGFAEDGALTASAEIWTISVTGSAWSFRVNGVEQASGTLGVPTQSWVNMEIGSFAAGQCDIAELRTYATGLPDWAAFRAEQVMANANGVTI